MGAIKDLMIDKMNEEKKNITFFSRITADHWTAKNKLEASKTTHPLIRTLFFFSSSWLSGGTPVDKQSLRLCIRLGFLALFWSLWVAEMAPKQDVENV